MNDKKEYPAMVAQLLDHRVSESSQWDLFSADEPVPLHFFLPCICMVLFICSLYNNTYNGYIIYLCKFKD
jgi:hypothetical protein